MNIAVLGSGSFGLAIALMLNENNNKITMWTKYEEEKNLLINHKGNPKLLPGVVMHDSITYTTNMEECVRDSDIIFIMVPAGFVDDVSNELGKYYKGQYICVGSKGIEQDSCRFVVDVIKDRIKTKKIAVISGPSFAIDLASYVPIGLTLACKHKKTALIIKKAIANKYLKIRLSDDVVGAEICGSIKNIIAIACGIVEGMGLPESTKAMLITESMHDIKELIHALGGNKKTIMSYAGIGDLILTCTSSKSRNFTYGRLIGSKASLSIINEYQNNTTIEGLYTLRSIYKLLKNKKVKMPIIDIMYSIIIKGENVDLIPSFLIGKK